MAKLKTFLFWKRVLLISFFWIGLSALFVFASEHEVDFSQPESSAYATIVSQTVPVGDDAFVIFTTAQVVDEPVVESNGKRLHLYAASAQALVVKSPGHGDHKISLETDTKRETTTVQIPAAASTWQAQANVEWISTTEAEVRIETEEREPKKFIIAALSNNVRIGDEAAVIVETSEGVGTATINVEEGDTGEIIIAEIESNASTKIMIEPPILEIPSQGRVSLMSGYIVVVPCPLKKKSPPIRVFNPRGIPYTSEGADFAWTSSNIGFNHSALAMFEPELMPHPSTTPDGQVLTGIETFDKEVDRLRNGRSRDCDKLVQTLKSVPEIILAEQIVERKIQGSKEKPQIHPDDLFYKVETKASKKVFRGLMKGLNIVQGFPVGEVAIGGSKKGFSDDQWGLWKVGFTPYDHPGSAWRVETGEGKPVVVAVIDSGLDITHPDFGLDNLWKNTKEVPGNVADDDGNEYIDDTIGWNFMDWNNAPLDDNGHGTFVTGIIAAKSDNGIGIAGINQGVKIMPLKVTNYKGKTNNFNIYRAIVYAVDNGARVINISLGGDKLSELEQKAVDYAYSNGVFVVVAAGNQGKKLFDYGPSGLQKVFVVAALDISGKRRGSSNYGPTVAITAPGEEIISLRARETDFLKLLGNMGSATKGKDGLYYQASGTSFAAPFVTGVASLLIAKDPDVTNLEIEEILLESALDIEKPGWDVRSGAGILNATGALSIKRGDILTARITKIEKVAVDKGKVSYNIYGIASGKTFEECFISVGKGKKPKKWDMVSPPSKEEVKYGLLGTVDGKSVKGFGQWNVRLTVKGADDKVKDVYLPIPKR